MKKEEEEANHIEASTDFSSPYSIKKGLISIPFGKWKYWTRFNNNKNNNKRKKLITCDKSIIIVVMNVKYFRIFLPECHGNRPFVSSFRNRED